MAFSISLDCHSDTLRRRMKHIIIIGGGVAGLSALNRLADLGTLSTLIESGSYPAHKLCGEFFSPESYPILSEWNLLPPTKIDKISLHSVNRTLTFSLESPAQSQSRYEFDKKLADRAKEKGCTLLTNIKVAKINAKNVVLENGSVLPYSSLIVSAGRFFGVDQVFTPQYIGIKGHLKGIANNDHLEMFVFRNGYAGLSPIGNTASNFACLFHKSLKAEMPIIEALYQAAPHLKKRLEQGTLIFKDWITSPVPPFGLKNNPHQPNVYFIGDAAGTIPPASGLGLTLALTSGYLVADYVLKEDPVGFQIAWKQKFSKCFLYGKLLHTAFMNPLISGSALALGNLFPTLPPAIFSQSRIS